MSTKKTRGGGVLIAVRADLSSSKLSLPDSICEELYVSISFNQSFIVCGAVYIPPNSDLNSYLDNISSMDFIRTTYPDANLCIAGDYNLPNLFFTNDSRNCMAGVSDKEKIICDGFSSLELFQHNHEINKNGVILDLILTSSSSTEVHSEDFGLVTVDDHHPPLCIILPTNHATSNIVPSISWYYNFKKANDHFLNNYFSSINWGSLL